jgi:predicted anti-sigma-YlaC factor YlaD
MSHQPFETWLFEDEALQESEAEALREHLAVCPSCRALSESWGEVSGLFHSSALEAPEPGFAARWQARLAGDAERARRRQAFAVLGVTAGSGLVLSAALVLEVLSLLRSPARVAIWIAENVSAIAAQLFLLREALTDLAADLPAVLTTAWPFAGLAIVALLGALWAFSLYRYAYQGVRR